MSAIPNDAVSVAFDAWKTATWTQTTNMQAVEAMLTAAMPLIRAQIADDINTAANVWLAAQDSCGPGPNGTEYDHGNVNGFIDGIRTAKRIVRGDP